jgi:hypothetical protein
MIQRETEMQNRNLDIVGGAAADMKKMAQVHTLNDTSWVNRGCQLILAWIGRTTYLYMSSSRGCMCQYALCK